MGRRRKPRNRTRVYVVQDKSGSMDIRREATISGFNEYINQLDEKLSGDVRISLIQFDTSINEKFIDRPLVDVDDLTPEDFVPGGMTALYDAVGRAISKASSRHAPDEKTLVVIMTDGGENSSREYKLDQILSKIEDKRAAGWDFVFLGAGEESWNTGQSLGFVGANFNKAIYYGSDSHAHTRSYDALAASTVAFASTGKADFDVATKTALEDDAKKVESR
jgi:uncharacterized protein YegL